MKCRRINCTDEPVAFIRINHTYDQGDGPTIDADWLYCQPHFEHHRAQHADATFVEFFETLEGYRAPRGD